MNLESHAKLGQPLFVEEARRKKQADEKLERDMYEKSWEYLELERLRDENRRLEQEKERKEREERKRQEDEDYRTQMKYAAQRMYYATHF